MSLNTVDIVMFAINSAAKLRQQARLAYIDSTRRREIALPLPNFFTGADPIDAVAFFKYADSGKKYVDGYTATDGTVVPANQRLQEIIVQWDAGARDDTLKAELKDFHILYFNLREIEEGRIDKDADPTFRDIDAALATLSIQMWRRNADPTASTLKRFAGAFIDIGIDYALVDQSLFDRKTKKGKALQSVLEGLDSLVFSDTPLEQLPSLLFVVTLETLTENPDLLTSDERKQEFLKATTTQIGLDAAAYIKRIQEDPALADDIKGSRLLDVQKWGQIVFRGTLNSGARLVAENPGKFLNVKDENQKALITKVGSSLLDFTLSGDSELHSILTQDGLETILKASLEVVGEHPEILLKSSNKGISATLSSLATSLAQTDGLLNKDVLPEVARLVLEKSGENLPLIWPDLENQPAKNLLLEAAQTTLGILAAPPIAGQTWILQFSKADLLEVTDSVIDQVLKNPGWLVTQAGDLNPTLKEVLTTTIAVLRTKADRRLNTRDAKEIIGLTLNAVALRKSFAEKLPNQKIVVSALIEAVIGPIFDPQLDSHAAWSLVGSETIVGLVDIALSEFASKILDDQNIATLAATLEAEIQRLSTGHPLDLEAFATTLSQQLIAIQS